MPFVATKDNGGKRDSNINKAGRPLKKDTQTLTRREAKDKEMLTLARKLKPGAQVALKEALKILNNEKSSEAAKLKAAEIYLKYFTLCMDKLYAPSADGEVSEDQTNVEDVQPQHKPAFSLHMLPPADTQE